MLAKLRKDDVLIVLSDHGFTSFRRGVNLNAWLLAQRLPRAQAGRATASAEWLRDVDWSRTRAYALGLTGIFLNLEGREAQGIVEPGDEAERAARQELIAEALRPARRRARRGRHQRGLRHRTSVYDGPYLGNAPDLIVGYNDGYRISWDGATGVVVGAGLRGQHQGLERRPLRRPADRARASSSATTRSTASDPALIDIAPTVLRLFGIDAARPHGRQAPVRETARPPLTPARKGAKRGESRAA